MSLVDECLALALNQLISCMSQIVGDKFEYTLSVDFRLQPRVDLLNNEKAML